MKPRIRVLQQSVSAPGMPAPASTLVQQEAPSAFMTALSASGGLLIVGGSLALVYGVSVWHVVTFATAPWVVLVLGKLIYLIFILVDDIRSVLGPSTAKPSNNLMPISKEE